MDNDNYNHIFHATNNRLAEILVGYNNYFMRGLKPPCTPEELGILISEVARRLRIPPYQTFNDEAFDM